MIATAEQTERERCTVNRVATAWEVGTGLRVALGPGEYQVTGSEEVGGERFLYLNETYHCHAKSCVVGTAE